MARTRKAAVGILAVAVLAIALGWYWRARSVGSGSASDPGPARGGELVVSVRAEPGAYNRYIEATTPAEIVSFLTDARLARVNRSTDQLEPWVAESWTESDDGLSFTLKLRPGVKFSDGTPLTSADVLFSFRALYDERVKSPLASGISVGGQPLRATAPDLSTVVITLPAPFAPGLRVLDNLPILPRHKLEPALDRGEFRATWVPTTPIGDRVGLGPFVLTEHVAGQRLVFVRNPHYWRRDDHGVQLPYLDRITVAVIPEQNTEALRLEAGEVDLAANAEIRPEDYLRYKRVADGGRLKVVDAGVGLDPSMLWFNLTGAPALQVKPWIAQREFRQAISHAVDRQAIIDTVFSGMAVPLYGPVTPGNRTWYSADAPTYPYDPTRARHLLSSIGLTDRNADGTLEDASGRAVRLSILTQRGNSLRERTAAMLQEHLRQVGIAIDVVPLDIGGIINRWSRADYEAIYFGTQASSTDPALNPDFWSSNGSFHPWHPHQPKPSTEWEARIDELMRRQAVSGTLAERQRLFAEAQRIVGEELPAIYFVAPRVVVVHAARVLNVTPALQVPQLLWSPDTLAVASARR